MAVWPWGESAGMMAFAAPARRDGGGDRLDMAALKSPILSQGDGGGLWPPNGDQRHSNVSRHPPAPGRQLSVSPDCGNIGRGHGTGRMAVPVPKSSIVPVPTIRVFMTPGPT